MNKTTIVSVELIDGKLEVVKMEEPESLVFNTTTGIIKSEPKVWKEVYVGRSMGGTHVARAEIVLLKKIPGVYYPAQSERWEFEEESENMMGKVTKDTIIIGR